jgi:hypothetical protein
LLLVFGIPQPPTNFGDELTEFAVVPGGAATPVR